MRTQKVLSVCPRHSWERVPTYVAADNSSDGNERHERACMRDECGLVKITVIPPAQPPWPWRRWRWPDGDEFEAGGTPECRGVAAVPVKLEEATA